MGLQTANLVTKNEIFGAGPALPYFVYRESRIRFYFAPQLWSGPPGPRRNTNDGLLWVNVHKAFALLPLY